MIILNQGGSVARVSHTATKVEEEVEEEAEEEEEERPPQPPEEETQTIGVMVQS